MEPSFKIIADLFAVPDAEVEIDETTPKVLGETADESDQLGRQNLNDGNFQTAIDHFRRAVEQRSSNDITSRIDLAGAYDYADDYPQALRQYEKALKAEAEAAEPHAGISDLYRRYGRFQDSVDQLRVAIEKEPENPYYHIKLAETLREAGFPRRALAAAQGAVLAKPDEPHYHLFSADLLVELKRYNEALDSYRAAIELSPGDDYLYLRATVAFWRAGRPIEAIKSIELASELDPSKALYHGIARELLLRNGRAEDAHLEDAKAEKMDRYDEDKLSRLLTEMGI
jgi:tetratricopeptide (TPR) repeat protein